VEFLTEDDKPVRPNDAQEAGPSKAQEAGPSKAQEAGPSKAPEGRSARSAIKRLEGGTSKAMTDRGKESKRKRKRSDVEAEETVEEYLLAEAEETVEEYLLAGELKNLRKMFRFKGNQMLPMNLVKEYNNGVATHMVQQIFT
jgi:hypothetical protein